MPSASLIIQLQQPKSSSFRFLQLYSLLVETKTSDKIESELTNGGNKDNNNVDEDCLDNDSHHSLAALPVTTTANPQFPHHDQSSGQRHNLANQLAS